MLRMYIIYTQGLTGEDGASGIDGIPGISGARGVPGKDVSSLHAI